MEPYEAEAESGEIVDENGVVVVEVVEDFAENAVEISAFKELAGEEKSITVYKTEKPTLNELLLRMPSELTVYTERGEERMPVTWYAVGADFDNSDGFYYQFSPTWDGSAYKVSDGFDIVRDAPYIEVFVTEPDSGSSSGNTSSDEPGEAVIIDPATVVLNQSQSANKNLIYRYLTGNLGLNTAAACGVLANIYCESGFNPSALGDGGTSYGICQWHNDRYTNLKNYCKENGYDYRTLTGQLNYLSYELNNSYASTYRLLKSVFNDSEASYYAGYSWSYNFESPKNKATVSITRGNLARDKYWASYSDDAGSEPIDLEAEEEKLLAERIEVESITLTQHSMTLLAGGDSADLDVIFDPKDATDKSVTYESSNPEVASVSSNGTVTPGRAGEAEITVSVSASDMDSSGQEAKSDTCKVKVIENDTSRIRNISMNVEFSTRKIPLKFGLRDEYAGVTVSFSNMVTYSENKIEPEKDLGATVDLSELTALVENYGLIRKGEAQAADLFDISFVSKNNKNVNDKAYFYTVLGLNMDRVNESRLKRREIAELERFVEAINEEFKANKCRYVINPLNLSETGEIRVALGGEAEYDENGELVNENEAVLEFPEEEGGHSQTLTERDASIRLMQAPHGDYPLQVIVTGDKNYTGSKTVTVNN